MLLRRLAPLALAIATLACSTTRELVAADGSHRLIGRDANTGVTMVVTTEVWAGDPIAGDDLTIVHVLIANMGGEPVLLAPGDFELRDRQGFDYTLYDAGGSFETVPAGSDPVAVATRQYPLGYDPGRSLEFDVVDDGEMSELALPWGVLLPGTQMRGFLYFDDVRDEANHATLVWHAQTPDHRALADFGFDLHVAVLDRASAGSI
jgi:hypothetical protein